MIHCTICTDKLFYIFTVAVMGFDSDYYTITEGENTFLFIAVEVMKGQLGREVVTTLTYKDVTATSLLFLLTMILLSLLCQFCVHL